MKSITDLKTLAKTDLEAYRNSIRSLQSSVKTLEDIYGNHIEGTPAETVSAFVKAVGYEEAKRTIASLINRSAWDGRISRLRSAWAASIDEAFDEEAAVDQYIYSSRIHLAHLDQIGAAFMKYVPEPEPEPEDLEEIATEEIAEEIAEEIKPANRGYHTERTLTRFSNALREARELVTSGADTRVRISAGNTKMGAVASVSLLPFLTCPSRCAGTCGAKCYAAKLALLRYSVAKPYAINTAMALHRSEEYWQQVGDAMKGFRFFRFHVSGDIINSRYFAELVKRCEENPHCEVLVFTKRFEIVNAWMDQNGALPQNLHLLFSGWSNLKPENPHGLPETTVIERGAEPEETWKLCGGNCFTCGCRGLGCWQAQSGDVIAFHIH